MYLSLPTWALPHQSCDFQDQTAKRHLPTTTRTTSRSKYYVSEVWKAQCWGKQTCFFYLRRLSESRYSSGSTLSIRLFIRKLLGCLVCVICSSKSFHFFLLKLCIMIVHILKTCTYYFAHISRLFFLFFWGLLNSDIFSLKMLRGDLVCEICKFKSFIPF